MGRFDAVLDVSRVRDALPRANSPRAVVTGYLAPLLFFYVFWKYCNKFLEESTSYLEAMSRDISPSGVQLNASYIPIETLTLIVGGVILICFLLIQNEFRQLESTELLGGMAIGLAIGLFLLLDSYSVLAIIKAVLSGLVLGFGLGLLTGFLLRGYYTSAFGMIVLVISYLWLPVADLSASSQIPFFFVGGAVLSGFLLLQNNLHEVFSIRPSSISHIVRNRDLKLGLSLASLLVFVYLTFQISLIPAISKDIPGFLSLILLLTVFGWSLVIFREGAKPAIQAHRTAALTYMLLLPLIFYFLLRVMYLQHNPDLSTQDRWMIKFDFMVNGNTFRINSWPFEVEPTLDSRWLFLKAAIINSVRVTLLSIVFCTILGIIVGVTRLSSNKLASSMATVYVEVFRNLPLAVLLFLIATQMGHTLPLFTDEENLLGGAVYYSNQGIWFATLASYRMLLVGLVFLALMRTFFRYSERVEPRRPKPLDNIIRRPFQPFGWKLEPMLAEVFVIFSALVFLYYLGPFTSTAGGAQGAAGGILLLLYALIVNTNVDDDGMNELEIDDSEEALRKRFTIWVVSFAFVAGLALSGGTPGWEISMPDYTKANLAIPGSWDITPGTGFEITPMFLAMILGLTLFTASTVAEIVRGSIQSLPRGQVEAAVSLGLNPYQRLRLVILPQALRSMVPLMNNQFMNVWKNSSLAIVVAYSDIFYVIQVMMNNVGKLIPLFILLLITYQVGSLMISAVMNWYNARVTSVKI